MPYNKDRKRDYKKEYKQDLEAGRSGPDSDQHERQRARRMYDKLGIDREDRHINHKKAIRNGGKSTKRNLRLRDPYENMSDNGR